MDTVAILPINGKMLETGVPPECGDGDLTFSKLIVHMGFVYAAGGCVDFPDGCLFTFKVPRSQVGLPFSMYQGKRCMHQDHMITHISLHFHIHVCLPELQRKRFSYSNQRMGPRHLLRRHGHNPHRDNQRHQEC